MSTQALVIFSLQFLAHLKKNFAFTAETCSFQNVLTSANSLQVEDNLDPIEEENASPVISSNSDIAESATLAAASIEAIEAHESPNGSSSGGQSSASLNNHRWSNNRRSQLLKQCHSGELNRVVFSDSRRRPLSCTPPASTSISTSVSIDEDETNNVKESSPNIKDLDDLEDHLQNSEAENEGSEAEGTLRCAFSK